MKISSQDLLRNIIDNAMAMTTPAARAQSLMQATHGLSLDDQVDLLDRAAGVIDEMPEETDPQRAEKNRLFSQIIPHVRRAEAALAQRSGEVQ